MPGTNRGNSDVFVMSADGGCAALDPTIATAVPPGFQSGQYRGALLRQPARTIPGTSASPWAGWANCTPCRWAVGAETDTIAMQLARHSPDGGLIRVPMTWGYEDSYRKHHTSSVTRDVWTFNTATGVPAAAPSFTGDRVSLSSARTGAASTT